MKVIERNKLADILYCQRCKMSRPALTKFEAMCRRAMQRRLPVWENMKRRRAMS